MHLIDEVLANPDMKISRFDLLLFGNKHPGQSVINDRIDIFHRLNFPDYQKKIGEAQHKTGAAAVFSPQTTL